MAMQTKQIFKLSLLITVFTLTACRSSGEADDGMGTETTNSANNSNSGANSNAATNNNRPTAAEIERENALGTTVFYFDFDVAEFKAADRQTLSHHARDLAANSRKRVRLEGHADERGTREYNLALGERRANSILNYLVVNGASRSQIEVVSYGEERPAQAGQSESSYRMNRRVEISTR